MASGTNFEFKHEIMVTSSTGNKLKLLNKEIVIDELPIFFNEIITLENLCSYFVTYNSQWTVEDGWLTGRNPEESAGMAILKRDFPGNILVGFECRTVPPSTHDINFMWNGEWRDDLNSCGNAYIGSICGWYSGRAGIEKSPDYKLSATTPNKRFVPGRIYKVHAGSINGDCFIFIDGKLAVELTDPEPLNSELYTKVAFTAWSSLIQIRNIVIRKITWKPLKMSYNPEF
jgi:hypothetical protein